jgi:hypothetical protein
MTNGRADTKHFEIEKVHGFAAVGARGGRFPLVTIGDRHGGTGGALNCR